MRTLTLRTRTRPPEIPSMLFAAVLASDARRTSRCNLTNSIPRDDWSASVCVCAQVPGDFGYSRFYVTTVFFFQY